MANTYYDSQLSAEEIENALEAVDGLIVPANNGKIIAVEDGTLVAKSVTEYQPGGATLEPLSVAANGDYYPGSGVDGFDEVHVSVPSSSADLYEQSSPFMPGAIALAFSVRATVQSSSGANGNITVAIAADSSWEGFDIAIPNLIPNRSYKLTFNLQYSGVGFVGGYSFDYAVNSNVASTYVGVYYTNHLQRDTSLHSYEIEFTATAATMYLSFAMAALSNGNHTIAITGIKIDANVITANGNYPIPSGYDGIGDTVVNVQPPLQAKTTTENGLIVADSGYYGLRQVLVEVSGGGGGGGDIDTSLLPASIVANVIASRKINKVGNINLISYGSYGQKAYVDLSDVNTDVTCYAVLKNTNGGESVLICVPYSNSNGNSPNFYTPSNSYAVECTVYAGNTRVEGVTCDSYHVYSLAIDSTNRKVRYFIDGVYIMEKSFNNSGNCVVLGCGDKLVNSYGSGGTDPLYLGVVNMLEADANIIANQQSLMTEFGIGT